MDFMGIMSTEFNSGGYLTHTPREAMVMECLSAFSDALDVYLTADTYHSEMVNFLGDRFERVPRWQRLADDTTQAFAEISEIKIKHSSLTGGAGAAAHIVFLITACYSLELCIQMLISFLFSFAFHFSSFHSYL